VRGQAHTLEAFVAGLLVLSGVVFALQATAVTPLSASTSNQHVGNQERAAAIGVMEASRANDTLVPAVAFWNTSREAFPETGEDGEYHNGGPPNAFGRALNRTFGDEHTAFNVDVRYRFENGSRNQVTMVDMGTPTDDATVASRNVVLFDGTELSSGSNGTVSNPTNGTFYAPDAEPNGPLYNVVEVRIVVWRI
jgi:hypothetical protein